ncbi:MAG TPA: AraC family transcriptional regulator, partial [Pseudomonadales bacterium]|nr:AraC family transcriptional regulator [Pseudomonadales bacterium]
KQINFDLPAKVIYGMPACQLRIPESLLSTRPFLADPHVAELARQQCEQEFQSLFADKNSLKARIEQVLKESPEQLPSLEEMAARFFMSSRTLKRRLQDESLNYRDLIEHELKTRALVLIKQVDLSISEIAFQLGYHDVSNFSRAFRRWTGKTPGEYRKRGG